MKVKSEINRQWFINLTGDQPEDFFGPDWENALEDWKKTKELEARQHPYEER